MNHPASEIVHASCVAYHERGLLILGPSGSGKSSLALSLMALGADLVADDRVIIRVENGKIRAKSPDTLAGLIEARGVGLLNADYISDVEVNVIVNLALTETTRLPDTRVTPLLGVDLPCYHRANTSAFPAALLQLLKSGRYA